MKKLILFIGIALFALTAIGQRKLQFYPEIQLRTVQDSLGNDVLLRADDGTIVKYDVDSLLALAMPEVDTPLYYENDTLKVDVVKLAEYPLFYDSDTVKIDSTFFSRTIVLEATDFADNSYPTTVDIQAYIDNNNIDDHKIFIYQQPTTVGRVKEEFIKNNPNEYYNAFPTIEYTDAGTLFVGYKKGTTHINGVPVYVTSKDFGKTWSDEQYFEGDFNDSLSYSPPHIGSFGDTIVAAYWSYANLKNIPTDEIVLKISNNVGESWEEVIVKDNNYDILAVSGKPIYYNGKYYLPCYGIKSGQPTEAIFFTSTDLQTWTKSTTSFAGYSEAELVEINGLLYMYMRLVSAVGQRSLSVSDDGTIFSSPKKVGGADGVEGVLPQSLTLSNGRILSYIRGIGIRNVQLIESTDGGYSFENSLELYAGQKGMYADFVSLGGNKVAYVYAIENFLTRAFVRFGILEYENNYMWVYKDGEIFPVSGGNVGGSYELEGFELQQGVGDDCYINLPALSGLKSTLNGFGKPSGKASDLSIRFKANELGHLALISYGDLTNNGYKLQRWIDGRIILNYKKASDGWVGLSSNTYYNDLEWHTIDIVYDEGTEMVTMTIDGADVFTKDLSTENIDHSTATKGFEIKGGIPGSIRADADFDYVEVDGDMLSFSNYLTTSNGFTLQVFNPSTSFGYLVKCSNEAFYQSQAEADNDKDLNSGSFYYLSDNNLKIKP